MSATKFSLTGNIQYCIAQTMNTKQRADFLILGAGVIGLTIARELRARHPRAEILILEKESAEAQHSSGRNSGVIHAGFYYSPDSLKARLTAQGNQRLREYCRAKQIPMNECSKVVVTRGEQELPGLDELARRGALAGAGVRLIDAQELADIDPNAKTYQRALYSPHTATVNPRTVCASFRRDLEEANVQFRFGTGFTRRAGEHSVEAGGTVTEYGHLVNTAGLYADRVAQDFGFSARYRILPFKGIYLVNQSAQPALRHARTNIYPVPNLQNPFLGVHFTLTADGKEKIGPTAIPAFWRENYAGLSGFNFRDLLETARIEGKLLLSNKFHFRDLARREMRKYLKRNLFADAAELVKTFRADADWRWGTPGIRAQLIDLETYALVQDFLIEGDRHSTHVLNAVSPAFTSSLAFAEHAVNFMEGKR